MMISDLLDQEINKKANERRMELIPRIFNVARSQAFLVCPKYKIKQSYLRMLILTRKFLKMKEESSWNFEIFVEINNIREKYYNTVCTCDSCSTKPYKSLTPKQIRRKII